MARNSLIERPEQVRGTSAPERIPDGGFSTPTVSTIVVGVVLREWQIVGGSHFSTTPFHWSTNSKMRRVDGVAGVPCHS